MRLVVVPTGWLASLAEVRVYPGYQGLRRAVRRFAARSSRRPVKARALVAVTFTETGRVQGPVVAWLFFAAPVTAGVVAHEAFHAAVGIGLLAEKTQEWSEEASALVCGNLTNHILRELDHPAARPVKSAKANAFKAWCKHRNESTQQAFDDWIRRMTNSGAFSRER